MKSPQFYEPQKFSVAILFVGIIDLLCTISSQASLAQYRLRYACTENQPLHLQIGKIDDDLLKIPEISATKLNDLLQLPGQTSLRYRLRDPSQYFQIDEVTSVLTAKQVFDVEALCPRYCRENSYNANLNIFVNLLSGHDLVAVVHIDVSVIDVDDNRPHFPETVARPYVLQLKEVIYRSGQHVELPKAVDKDVNPLHAEIAYRLDSHLNDNLNALETFRLVVRNDTRLMLVLQRDLDYEYAREYRFYLVAWCPRINEPSGNKAYVDSNTGSNEDKLEIIVKVLNINDIEPVFSQSVYNVEVAEDTPVDTSIFQLEATDRDANSTITYSMEIGTDKNTTETFKIQSDGQVIITKKLDFEQRSQYGFSVRASDGEFFALARLVIKIRDVNDELPEYILSPSKLVVEENMPARTMIGHLIIIDRDGVNLNGQVECEEPVHLMGKQPILFVLESPYSNSQSDNFQMPLLVSSTSDSIDNHVFQRYTMYTRNEFDRETGPTTFESLLICWDGVTMSNVASSVRHTATMTITLTVADQNDNSPVFEQHYYKAEIKENCPIGTKVVQNNVNDSEDVIL